MLICFPGGSEVKVSACNAGDLGSIPGLGKSPGEGNGNPLQYSCLENPTDGGAWWATVHGVAKSWTRLSDFTSLHAYRSIYRCWTWWIFINYWHRLTSFKETFFLIYFGKRIINNWVVGKSFAEVIAFFPL